MRLTAKAAVATAAVVVSLAAQAGAQSPPAIPNVPTVDVARFQVTVRGVQSGDFKFKWIPGNSCGWHAEGTLTEHWEYARGKAVAMEFSKLARGVVLLGRVGRPPGDAAFAAPGSVTRTATGFFDMGAPAGCGGMHSLVGADCGKVFKVQSDLHLLWSKGRLTLEKASTVYRSNPADDCGWPEGVLNFDGFTSPYPALYKQRGKLPAKKIFGSKRAFKLDLKSNFVEPLRDSTWPDSKESLIGTTRLTFRRLPKR